MTKPYNLPTGFLSPTQITQYMRCPACYEAEYVLRKPRRLSVSLPLGVAVHKGVEVMRSHLLAGEEWELDECRQMATETFAKVIASRVEEDSGAEAELDLGARYQHIGMAVDHAADLAGFAADQLYPVDRERGLLATEVLVCNDPSLILPRDLERSGGQLEGDALALAWPFPVKGYIDAVYGAEGITLISDLKTTSKNVAPDTSAAIQTMMYARPIALEGPPPRVVIDSVVKTSFPQFHSYELGEGVTSGVSQHHHDVVYGIVVDVAEEISRGHFPPRPGFLCNYVHDVPGFSLVVDMEINQ